MISRSLRDKPATTVPAGGIVEISPKTKAKANGDAPIRLSISVSPKMSEMSSTGRDSKVNMVVVDEEVRARIPGIPFQANQLLSSFAPPQPTVGLRRRVCSIHPLSA